MTDEQNDRDEKIDVRLDKWLWAARFFKTRGLAAAALTGGKIEINGARPKASRSVRAGDRLTIRRGPYEWTVIVQAVDRLRRPAAHAQTLYEETEEKPAPARSLRRPTETRTAA
jgi:ribosome-associated heat shock protein Hsp15